MKRFALLFSVFAFCFSSPADTFTETEKGRTLIKKEVKHKLTESYEGRKKEKAFCLFGTEDKIKRLSEPETVSSTDTTTTWKTRRCESKRNFVGYVHNHEISPKPSTTDKFRFALNDDSKIEVIAYQNSGDITFHAYFTEDK